MRHEWQKALHEGVSRRARGTFLPGPLEFRQSRELMNGIPRNIQLQGRGPIELLPRDGFSIADEIDTRSVIGGMQTARYRMHEIVHVDAVADSPSALVEPRAVLEEIAGQIGDPTRTRTVNHARAQCERPDGMSLTLRKKFLLRANLRGVVFKFLVRIEHRRFVGALGRVL